MTERFKDALMSMGANFDEPMSRHTSFKIGGNADCLLVARNDVQIVDAIKTAQEEGVSVFIMGNGSNLLVRDGGIRALVIKIAEGMDSANFDGTSLVAGAGAKLITLARECMQRRLAGLECVGGIPGTLGGAIYMNAGAYGAEICEALDEVYYIDADLELVSCPVSKSDFGYRTSVFAQSGAIITGAKLALCEDSDGRARGSYDACNIARRTKQPLNYPCAGSVFKRPAGFYAGKLIQDSALMGYSIGGAQVSTLHAGFIVNNGNASAKDVLSLIQHIQTVVSDKFGVLLEPEIKIVGEG